MPNAKHHAKLIALANVKSKEALIAELLRLQELVNSFEANGAPVEILRPMEASLAVLSWALGLVDELGPPTAAIEKDYIRYFGAPCP